MTSEAKKFINGQEGLSKVEKSAILSNLLGFAVMAITFSKNVVTAFLIYNFNHFEHLKIPTENVRLFEVFFSFNNLKNACNSLMLVAEGSPFNDAVFQHQAKNTPKTEIKGMGFQEFLDNLTETQLKTLRDNINAWFDHHLLTDAPNIFELNYINKEGTLKKGDMILYSTGQYSGYAKILQAMDNGFVECIDAKGFFTLQTENFKIIPAETVPKEDMGKINKKFTQYEEAGEEHRIDALESLTKRAETTAKQQEKAQKSLDYMLGLKRDTREKVEKLQERLDKNKTLTPEQRREVQEAIDTSITTFDKQAQATAKRLNTLKLDSEEKIKEAVKELNASTIVGEERKKIAQRLKEAKAKLTPPQETPEAKPKAKAKETKKAPKNAKTETAKA